MIFFFVTIKAQTDLFDRVSGPAADCEWNEWGSWSLCSKPCSGELPFGQSTRSRTHTPESLPTCQGNSSEEKICNAHACKVECSKITDCWRITSIELAEKEKCSSCERCLPGFRIAKNGKGQSVCVPMTSSSRLDNSYEICQDTNSLVKCNFLEAKEACAEDPFYNKYDFGDVSKVWMYLKDTNKCVEIAFGKIDKDSMKKGNKFASERDCITLCSAAEETCGKFQIDNYSIDKDIYSCKKPHHICSRKNQISGKHPNCKIFAKQDAKRIKTRIGGFRGFYLRLKCECIEETKVGVTKESTTSTNKITKTSTPPPSEVKELCPANFCDNFLRDDDNFCDKVHESSCCFKYCENSCRNVSDKFFDPNHHWNGDFVKNVNFDNCPMDFWVGGRCEVTCPRGEKRQVRCNVLGQTEWADNKICSKPIRRRRQRRSRQIGWN